MTNFAVQYLEDGPGVVDISPDAARIRLRAAFERLPISLVLLGWNLSPEVVASCRDETARWNAQLYRWQPLLTGDGAFMSRPEWQIIGVDGERVAGFRGLPEFTFVCPNRLAVQEAVLSHVSEVLRSGRYQGVFLDRIRFPSPALAPASILACFCEDCRRAAAADGLDLEPVRRAIQSLAATTQGKQALVQALLNPQMSIDRHLSDFLHFRERSVTRFVHAVVELVHAQGLEVGLDCFSPSLTHMVGQDLSALGACAEWVKIMTYGHSLGPAGLPFELLGLIDWLAAQAAVDDSEALAILSGAIQLPLPPDRQTLKQNGLSPSALALEAGRGIYKGIKKLLIGIELVEISGVTQLNTAQITSDLVAFRSTGADGLVLSWDLWQLPLERLDLVRQTWL